MPASLVSSPTFLLRPTARRRLAWLRRAAAAGTLTLAMLHGAPDGAAQAPTPDGGEFQVNTFTTDSQGAPSVAADSDGDFVVVWDGDGAGDFSGIFGQRYASDGTPQGSEFRANATTSSTQSSPSVAMNAAGDFVVAWASLNQDGDSFGIFAQRFASDGTPEGAEFQVNTYTTDRQLMPSVAMDDDGAFVVAWQSEGQDGSDIGIFAQRYAANGTPQGSEFQVNVVTNDDQREPSVSMDADGDFVVAWSSPDGSGVGIFARRFAADGTPQGGEFQVNATTLNGQLSPSVALDADGDFVVAWTGQAGSTQDIFAQRYAAAGTPQGSEFQVNTTTANGQNSPQVGITAGGNFVIVWTSFSQDGDGDGIFAQRYASEGTPEGTEFQVNTFTADDQQAASVAVDADGDLVIAWESGDFGSQTQDGDYFGIFAQRYAAAVVPVELTRFDAVLDGDAARLSWATASETVNAGFEVQRRAVQAEGVPMDGADWAVLDFVPSAVPSGTTSEGQTYAFTDAALPFGAAAVRYRLRQVDFDGAFAYSPEVEVAVALPAAFGLSEVYPNPARAAATVAYTLPTDGPVRLAVYDALGREVAVLHEGPQTVGRHAASLAMANLSAGVYVVRLETGGRAATRRVTVLR